MYLRDQSSECEILRSAQDDKNRAVLGDSPPLNRLVSVSKRKNIETTHGEKNWTR
jgi:hypothetical protein